jgi:hypothetical protein
MFCCQMNDMEIREGISYHDSPLRVRLLEKLGLKSFAINKFVFARPEPSTDVVKKNIR